MDHGGDDESTRPTWFHAGANETAPALPPLPAFHRLDARLPRSSNDNGPSLFEDGPAHELDCLRNVLAPQLLRAAERRSRELRIGADQVLIHWGVIDEAAYLRRLSFYIGVDIETFARADRADSPLEDSQLPFAAASGIVPMRQDGRLIWTLAPRRFAARTLCALVAEYPWVKPHARLTLASSLQQFLTQQGSSALAHEATHGLGEKFPTMSAAPSEKSGALWWQRLKRGLGVAALAAIPPALVGTAWADVLAVWFLAFIGLRLTASFWPRKPLPDLPRLSDARLPVYTIVAALYREASSIAPLFKQSTRWIIRRKSSMSSLSSNRTICTREPRSRDWASCRMCVF